MPGLRDDRPESHGPPGLSEADINALLPKLPNGRGLLRIVGYYLNGGKEVVVYDVLDEQGTRVTDLHMEHPPNLPFLPPGTLYRLR